MVTVILGPWKKRISGLLLSYQDLKSMPSVEPGFTWLGVDMLFSHCPPTLQARLFDEPQLASLCLENIDKNTADAITAEGFTDIDLGEAHWSPSRPTDLIPEVGPHPLTALPRRHTGGGAGAGHVGHP